LKLVETTGLITKEIKYGDTSRIITIITPDLGKISAITNKSKSGKGKNFSSLQLFSYYKFVLFKGSEKGLYHINEADIIESFKPIRDDLMAIIYASYFSDVANSISVENVDRTDFLRLILNIFYALSKGGDYDKIKTVFEWKTAFLEGYTPDVEKCSGCGLDSICFFDLGKGECFCKDCGKAYAGTAQVNRDIVEGIRYIRDAEFSKMLSFELNPKAIEYMNSLSEIYLKMHLEHEFKTLEYLKKMK